MYKSQDPEFMKAKYASMFSALTIQPEDTISTEENSNAVEGSPPCEQSQPKHPSASKTKNGVPEVE